MKHSQAVSAMIPKPSAKATQDTRGTTGVPQLKETGFEHKPAWCFFQQCHSLQRQVLRSYCNKKQTPGPASGGVVKVAGSSRGSSSLRNRRGACARMPKIPQGEMAKGLRRAHYRPLSERLPTFPLSLWLARASSNKNKTKHPIRIRTNRKCRQCTA